MNCREVTIRDTAGLRASSATHRRRSANQAFDPTEAVEGGCKLLPKCSLLSYSQQCHPAYSQQCHPAYSRQWHPLFAACLLLLAALPGSLRADMFSSYQRRPELDFLLPEVADGTSTTGGAVMDHLPDGRRVTITTRLAMPFDFVGAAELRVETAAGTGDFRYLGDLPLNPADEIWFNPGGFLSISQGAAPRVAVGNSSGSVGVFAAADLVVPAMEPAAGTAAPVGMNWFDSFAAPFILSAAWLDDTHLAVGSGNFGDPSQVNLLDTSSDAGAPTAPLLVSGIDGATGGLAFDMDQNLLVGLGSGDDVGLIHRFDAAAWMGGAQAFASGSSVAQLLSGFDLQFDADGNLLVGGGDVFGSSGQVDYFAIHDLTGLLRPAREFDPDPIGLSSYSLMLNDATGVIYAWDSFGTNPRQVYAFAVPEPGTLALIVLVMAALPSMRLRRTHKPGGTPGRLSDSPAESCKPAV